MQKQVIIRDDQNAQAEDMTNLQDFVRASIDNVVKDGIDSGRKYAGLAVSETGPTEITAEVGRLYSGGEVYLKEVQSVFSVIAHLPTVTQRMATVVVWGVEEEEDIQPRAFLVNAETEEFQPQEVTMRRTRVMKVDVVYGSESASPQRGNVDSGVVAVCDVLLDSSGIVSITMDEDTALSSVAECQIDLTELNDWRVQISGQVDTLRTDLARIAAKIPPNPAEALAAIFRILDDIMKRLNKPATAVATFIDRFRNTSESDLVHAGYAARVEDGLNFPSSGNQQIAISLLNPIDPGVMTTSNITLPAHVEVDRPVVDRKYASGYVLVTNYPVITLNWIRQHISRRCLRYGKWAYSVIARPPVLNVMTNWLGQSVVVDQGSAFGLAEIAVRPDLSYLTMRRGGGELYTVAWDNFWRYDNIAFLLSRKGRRWVHDHYHRPYWRAIVSASSGAGASIAQTWLEPSNCWMKSVTLHFRDKALSGDLQILVCETTNGVPDEDRVISSGSLAAASINTSFAGIRIPVIPCLLEAGNRYAIIITTGGAHSLRTAVGNLYSQGALFNRAATNVWVGTGLADICFSIGRAKFDRTRSEIQMTSPQLVGGVTDIRIAAAAFVPDGTRLVWEVLEAGVWSELEDNEVDALASAPAVLPIRAVFIGTYDLQPGIDLTQSELEVSASAFAYEHWSDQYVPGGTTNRVDVTYDVEGWNAAQHTLVARLYVGGVLQAAAGTITTTPDPQDATKMRKTFQFTLSSAANFTIKTNGTTVAGQGFYNVNERWAYVF